MPDGDVKMTENFSSNYDRSCVEIDLNALKHNFEEIKKATTPGTGILAVVKADAYGHGLSIQVQLASVLPRSMRLLSSESTVSMSP